MKLFIAIIVLFTSTAFAEDCRPKGTTFVEVMQLEDFKTTSTDKLIIEFREVIEKLADHRKRNCKDSPDKVKQDCRGYCGLLSYKKYRDTCSQFCEVQRLKIIESDLGVCEGKLVAITQIEKDLRAPKRIKKIDKSASQ